MVSLAEIETAVAALSPADKFTLLQRLTEQLARSPHPARSQGSHSVLDIPPVHLGQVLKPWNNDDDILGEMLEGRF